MRPDCCPDLTCEYLLDRDRFCVGRKSEMFKHDELYDTHNFCTDCETMYINAADAFYYIEMMSAVIKDVEDNNLYDAKRGEIWDIFRRN